MTTELQPTTLTPEILATIADMLSKDKTPTEISKAISIPLQDLKALFIKQRKERLIDKAEQFSEKLLDVDQTKLKPMELQVLRLKQAEAAFIRETLGKEHGYSKRSEVTGKDGDAIHVKEIIFTMPTPQPHEDGTLKVESIQSSSEDRILSEKKSDDTTTSDQN